MPEVEGYTLLSACDNPRWRNAVNEAKESKTLDDMFYEALVDLGTPISVLHKHALLLCDCKTENYQFSNSMNPQIRLRSSASLILSAAISYVDSICWSTF
eukprot:TRINITY_DN504_c0_g4_i1.p2 TRINITY_DN504_c0_g4~~TRINITY_DN504_c0_g4_i1.p2  ORF type:complete len:100 (+),score=20.34 TRINITY_DN504_c0_g4_i1:376-675(+)